MVNLGDIEKYPTTVNGIHQSVYKDHMVLAKVIDLIEADTPKEVLLELIGFMLSRPQLDKQIDATGGYRAKETGSDD